MTTSDFHAEFNSLSSGLRKFAFYLTNNVDDAKDLFQETAYVAFKNREKFKIGSNFRGWFMTIMRNTFINGYRKKVRASVIFDSKNNQLSLIDLGPTVSNQCDSNIMMSELLGMVDQLEERLGIPFLMHYEGYKYSEIADQLGLPLGTIKSRIFQARQILREGILDKYEYRTDIWPELR